ncbi:hypothetical protein [Magnetovibrio blakemorei]|uniref:PepSY domain-containing protein n=1 Tax=Magnetovibrio blakemorei TaxID=28181 RepID=A0A1E5QAM7_9PROT|nr:hypothetical protein [Magnetovibrio blakemorei]OEJ68908.1 hypothetical protein BEN30_05205 [Magnetovibrio blakemorei]
MKTKTLIITAVVAIASLGAVGAYAHSPYGYHGGGYGMGPGISPGMGYGMNQGMGRGMMNNNMGGQGCPNGQVQALAQPLTIDDVRANMEQHLKQRGNDRLKVGQVTELDDKTIVAEIVTVDDSLVKKVTIDKATGRRIRTK